MLAGLWKAVGSGIVGIIIWVIGWVVKRWILPWFDSATKLNIAQAILKVADDLTDWLVEKFPDASWDDILDRVVDKLIEIFGVSEEVAERVARATIRRKANGK